MKDKTEKHYTVGEEIANSLTHGLGTGLSIAALTLMVVFAAYSADPWRIVGVTIFGVSMVLLYLASTLYHAFPQPSVKRVLRVFDHCAIYLLIAGTYTPFLLVNMRGPWGWTLLVILWATAILGCAFKAFHTGRWDKTATLLYIVMGWTIVIALKPAVESVPVGAIVLMLLGGLAYTSGVGFYLWQRLPYHHAIWHVFVLGGSIFHFLAIFFFIAIA